MLYIQYRNCKLLSKKALREKEKYFVQIITLFM